MSSQGPNSPTAASSKSSVNVEWSNPTNVYSSNDARAEASLTGGVLSNRSSQQLFITGFGFTIPSGATIDGIVASIERSVSSTSGNPRDDVISLTKDGASSDSESKADGTTWPTSDTSKDYGGAADLWATSWTYTEINASTFGILVKAKIDGTETASTVRVDHCTITVYYTGGEAPAGKPYYAYAQQQ